MKINNLILKLWRKVGVRPAFRSINELMFDCALHGLGLMNHESDDISGEAYFVRRILPRFVDVPAPVLIDVGANIGGFSELLCEVFPSAKIYAVEANPRVFTQLQARVSKPNVNLINRALGAAPGAVSLFDRQDHEGASEHGSLYREVIEQIHQEESVEYRVTMTTLDQLAREGAWSQVHLLKIDTEGHEAEVLKGAAELIAQGRVDIVLLEFNEMNTVSRVFFRDLAQALPNYKAFRLLPRGVVRVSSSPVRRELFGFQNVVFVHPRFHVDNHMRIGARVS